MTTHTDTAPLEGMRQLNNLLAHQQGFVSAVLLRSLDGMRLADYVQWKHEGLLDAARQSSGFQQTLYRFHDLIIDDQPRIYDVVYTSHPHQHDVTTLREGGGVTEQPFSIR